MKFITIQLLLAILVYGCSKDLNCKVKFGNEGLIVKHIADDYCWKIAENNFVIRTDSAFHAIIKIDSANCAKPIFEEIDFSRYTMLGQYAQTGGCSAGFLRTVTQNNAEKKMIYEVFANGCGECEELSLSYNIVLVPKIPKDYSVEFILR
ncbi:MAG: hypothetical protein ACXWEY_09330 [Bacteroidia bacterium]